MLNSPNRITFCSVHLLALDTRAMHRSVRAVDAAITLPGPQLLPTLGADVQDASTVVRHRLLLREPAGRAGDDGFSDDDEH